ncbi:MAG TPA: flippase [Candidatus Dormibacteraeota bacterium]|nr:flippase [Candidatus Dormibacteraeota bacterium]
MSRDPAPQSPLVRTGTITLASRVVVFALSLAAGVILARTLGPQGRGLYALALVAPSALTLVANLGVSQALTYYLARREFPVDSLIGHAITLALLLGAATTVLLVAVMAVAGRWVLPGVPFSLVVIASLSIPLGLFFYFSLSFVQGKEDFVGFNALYLVNALALVLLLVPLFAARGNVALAVGAWSLSWVPTAVLGVFLLSRHGRLNLRLEPRVARALFRFGIVGYVGFVTNYLNFRLDAFLVNIFTNAAQVGFYAVAVSLAETIWYVASAASTVLAPRVASSEPATSDITTGRVSRVVVTITMLGAVALGLVASPLIRLLFGGAFAPSVLAVWLLLPGIVTSGVARVLSGYLLGRNRLIVDFAASLAGLGMTLVFDIVLIPRYGFAGAAVASSLAYTTTMLVNMRWVVRNSSLTVKTLLVPTWADVRAARQLWGRPS